MCQRDEGSWEGKGKLLTESSCDLAQQNSEEDVKIMNKIAARPASADRWQHLKAKQNERKKYESKHSKERWCNKALALQRKMEPEEGDGWKEGEIN